MIKSGAPSAVALDVDRRNVGEGDVLDSRQGGCFGM
jgi:hypothetical protein